MSGVAWRGMLLKSIRQVEWRGGDVQAGRVAVVKVLGKEVVGQEEGVWFLVGWGGVEAVDAVVEGSRLELWV